MIKEDFDIKYNHLGYIVIYKGKVIGGQNADYWRETSSIPQDRRNQRNFRDFKHKAEEALKNILRLNGGQYQGQIKYVDWKISREKALKELKEKGRENYDKTSL